MTTLAPTERRPGLVRNAFHLGVGQATTTVLTILFSSLVARTLGAKDFGLLYLITSFATFAYVFVEWGHAYYVTREIARHSERAGELIGSVLAVRALSALLMCVLTTAIAWLAGYETRIWVLTAALILALLPQYLGLTYSWAFRGSERMEYDAAIQVVLKLATLVFAAGALAFGGRLPAVLAAYAGAGFLTLAAALFGYRRLRLPDHRVHLQASRELIWNGAPMMAIAVAIAVQPYIDANLLYKLVPMEVIGWYGAAWTIAGTLVAPATILASTIYPRLSRVCDDAVEFRRTLSSGFRPLLTVALLGAVGTYLFADFAVSVVYARHKFGPAAQILRAFAPVLVLIYIDMLLGHAILAVGKAGLLARAKVVAVLVTTALEVMLIRYFQQRLGNGGIGVMVSMAGGELVMIAAAVALARHVVSRSMALDVIRGLCSTAATILIMRGLSAVSPLAGIPICVAVFAACSIGTGLIRLDDVSTLKSALTPRRPSTGAEGSFQPGRP
jgi:O-antigen/teichoic acid export membrane protein